MFNKSISNALQNRSNSLLSRMSADERISKPFLDNKATTRRPFTQSYITERNKKQGYCFDIKAGLKIATTKDYPSLVDLLTNENAGFQK